MATNSAGNTGAAPTSAPSGILSLEDAVAAQLVDPTADTSEGEPDPKLEDAGDDTSDDGDTEDEDEDEDKGDTDDQEPAPDLDASEQTDDDEDQDDDDFVELAPENVLFKHDGVDVTLGEAEKGFLRQSDYTRKTSDLAVDRKAVAEERKEIAQEREHYALSLENMQTTLEAASSQQIDWDTLKETDPVAYLQHKEAERERQDQFTKIQAEQARVRDASQAEQATVQTQYRQEQETALMTALPSWEDKKVAVKEKTEILEYLTTSGFSPEETEQILDHRLVLMLRDAVAGASLRKGGKMSAKKLAKTRPMMKKAGAGPRGVKKENVRKRQAETALDKSGSFEDAMALQMERLTEG